MLITVVFLYSSQDFALNDFDAIEGTNSSAAHQHFHQIGVPALVGKNIPSFDPFIPYCYYREKYQLDNTNSFHKVDIVPF
jgi:hypothetical protein